TRSAAQRRPWPPEPRAPPEWPPPERAPPPPCGAADGVRGADGAARTAPPDPAPPRAAPAAGAPRAPLLEGALPQRAPDPARAPPQPAPARARPVPTDRDELRFHPPPPAGCEGRARGHRPRSR